MSIKEDYLNIKKARENRQKGLDKCSLKLFVNPLIRDEVEGNGPVLDVPDSDKAIYENFVDTMEATFDDNLLTSMHNNIDKLVVKKAYNVPSSFVQALKNDVVGGKYNCLTNTVTINGIIRKKHQKQLINRELLHMSASHIKGLRIYDGLSQKIGKVSVGHGLNTGYVDLLTEKLFNGHNYHPKRVFQKENARLIENLVGEKRMAMLYFNNNLEELRDYLAYYTSKDEANGFLVDLDLMCSNMKYYPRVIEYLAKVYDLKINRDYQFGVIDGSTRLVQESFLNREIALLEKAGNAEYHEKQFIKEVKRMGR